MKMSIINFYLNKREKIKLIGFIFSENLILELTLW